MTLIDAFQGSQAFEGERLAGAQANRAPKSATVASNPGLIRRLALPALVITIQALVATASLHTLSILRVFVACESVWSKSQKNAFNALDQYLDRGEEQDYQRFRAAVAQDWEHNRGRQALEKPEPDRTAAARHLRNVGVHPDDIAGTIFIFENFHGYSHFREATAVWRETDAMLADLVALGETIRDRIGRGEQPANDPALRTHLREFDDAFQARTIAFSQALGAGTREVTTQLTIANVGLAFTLIALVVWRMRALFQRSLRFKDALRSQKEQAQVTLQAIGDGVIRLDAQSCVDYVNPAAERLIGMSQADAFGRPIASLIMIVDQATKRTCHRSMDALLKGEAQFDATRELALVTAAGSTPISVRSEPLETAGEPTGAVLVLRDMTRERDLIARLTWQASHDELTGLVNRRELDRRLRLRQAESDNREDALALLDLDQFKLVNDTCGHAAGDQLLREIATLLKLELGEAGLPVRLGGDEFAALVIDCDVVRATAIAEKLREAIQDFTFVWDGRPFKISASIGLVANIGVTSNAEDVFRAADVACYLAKDKGRNRVELHEASGAEILRRVSEMGWVHKIRDALNKGHLCLFAQRISALQSESEGEHFELLVRMRDEQGKLVAPGSFIPAAERYGLMPSIDRWVVNAAFMNLARITAVSPSPIHCAINLSGQSLDDPTFIDFVESQFLAYAVAPSAITFEVTETAAIANLEEATRFIDTFRKIGCKFSLDDFGAGMSSFGYLKRLPVDYLKIDGSFVKDILVDPIDHAMVDMIARMARKLGKKTIAEFAETDEIVDALRELGIDYAQGYAVGAPVSICREFGRARTICHSSACRRWTDDAEVARCA
jgi:diguanylate cyclase (GGDEF)-like protein/PAS domain S-box-containing protein